MQTQQKQQKMQSTIDSEQKAARGMYRERKHAVSHDLTRISPVYKTRPHPPKKSWQQYYLKTLFQHTFTSVG